MKDVVDFGEWVERRDSIIPWRAVNSSLTDLNWRIMIDIYFGATPTTHIY